MLLKQMRPVAIMGGTRTPFVKSFSSYTRTSNKELMTATLKEMVKKFNLQNVQLGDVALGAVMKNAEDWNLARESVLQSGLHPHTPGYDVQRACGTGLETLAQITLKIASGQIESGIGGGTDTNSDIAGVITHELSWALMDVQKARTIVEKIKKLAQLKPQHLIPKFPIVQEPQTGLSMGEHCELMVKEWKISREAQDLLAYDSHQKAWAAYERGFFDDLMFDYKGVKRDAILRPDTTLAKLAKLKPAFDFSGNGTLTAGNSTALTDGASAVLLGSEDFADQYKLPIMAYFVDAEFSAVDFVKGEGLLMAPVSAVSKLLQRNNLTLSDFDFYEIHEAFAGQVLCTLKAFESTDYCQKNLGLRAALGSIDKTKLNVNGSSLAVGHPFAATGGRIVATLAKLLHDKGSGRGLISICTAGGMGVAAIIERPE